MPLLHIPQPCLAKRSQMSATERGSFCQLCQKEVLDFSQMSDAEIRRALATSQGKVCASLREDQVGRYIGPVVLPKRWLVWGLGLALLGPAAGLGQVPETDAVQGEEQAEAPEEKSPARPESDSLVLRGKVVAKETGEPIEGAAVIVKGTKLGGFTHADGTYAISLSEASIGLEDSLALIVQYLGRAGEEIWVSPRHESLVRMVKMEAIFVGEIPLTPWQRFWFWVTSPFRRH